MYYREAMQKEIESNVWICATEIVERMRKVGLIEQLSSEWGRPMPQLPLDPVLFFQDRIWFGGLS
jgi:hypothetical protein